MFLYTLMNLIKSPWRSFQLLLSAVLVFILLLTAVAFQESINQSLSVSGDEKNIILVGT